MSNRQRLFLISNSKTHGKGYLEHCSAQLLAFLGGIKSILFIPFALSDWKKYTETVREALKPYGIEVIGIDEGRLRYADMVGQAKAVFVGGGNTFRLLDLLHQHTLIKVMHDRVDEGMPYIGSSAGSNVACPTIKTTNDMPIVHPPSFDAFNLVPFQINPHYFDADPTSTHMGETREQRIAEYLEIEEHPGTVIGLREGSWLVVENGVTSLHGPNGAKIFKRGVSPTEWSGAMSF